MSGSKIPFTSIHWISFNPKLFAFNSNRGHLLGIFLDGRGLCSSKGDPWGHYFVISVITSQRYCLLTIDIRTINIIGKYTVCAPLSPTLDLKPLAIINSGF